MAGTTTPRPPNKAGILICKHCPATVPATNPDPEKWPQHRCASDKNIHPFTKFLEGRPKLTLPR